MNNYQTAVPLSRIHAGQGLNATLAGIEAQVREHPNSAEPRWALAEMLCVLGEWERAQQQAQACARLDARWQGNARALQSLIQAERQRGEVFAGRAPPLPLGESAPWLDDLAAALVRNAAGETEAADVLRERALEAAPATVGICVCRQGAGQHEDVNGETLAEHAFEWIGDSDTRLGPVCELIVSGGYRWLPFADVATISLSAPKKLLDLVWLPAQVGLRTEGQGVLPLQAFIPVRYCSQDAFAAEAGAGQRDALLLARLTLWRERGRTLVAGSGQRTWISDGVDWPLLDVRELRFVGAGDDQDSASGKACQ